MITCPGCRKVVRTHYRRHMITCPDIPGVRVLYAAALADPAQPGHIRNRAEYSDTRPAPLWSGESLCKHYGETWAAWPSCLGYCRSICLCRRLPPMPGATKTQMGMLKRR